MEFKKENQKFNLEPNTLFLGHHLVELQNVDSTNNYAVQLLKDGNPPEGTVVIAHQQYAGKGQHNRSWESAPNKNITLSLLLYPSFLHSSHSFLLTATIALGLIDTIRELMNDTNEGGITERLKIKWPNDIYYEDQKLAGILTETNWQQQKMKNAIVGVGLNVNQDKFPSDLANPTSLKKITGQNFDRSLLLKKLLSHTESRYLQLKQEKFERIRQPYIKMMYRYQEYHRFLLKKSTPHEQIIAQILGISDDGKLALSTGDQLIYCLQNEIEFIL